MCFIERCVKLIEYRLLKTIISADGKEYTSYGIEAIDEHSTVLAKVCDITLSLEKAVALCDILNACGLAPYHLKDAAEDFIISDLY